MPFKHTHPIRHVEDSPIDIWRDDWSLVSEIRSYHHVRISDEIWCFPDKEKMSLDYVARKLDFTKAIPTGIDIDDATLIKQRLKRLMFLFATVSSGLTYKRDGSGHIARVPPLETPTLCKYGRIICRLTHNFLKAHHPSIILSGDFFDHPGWRKEFINLDASAPECNAVLMRIRVLAEHGKIDYSIDAAPKPTKYNSNDDNVISTKPFPDDELTEILRASLAISKRSIDFTKMALAMLRFNGIGLKQKEIPKARRGIIRQWKSEKLYHSDVLEYTIECHFQVVRKLEDFRSNAIPYLSSMHIINQAAHFCILLFATGMRPKELNTLKRDCIREIDYGALVSGFQFKDVERLDGEPREWPLPHQAVEIIRRQQLIGDLLDPDGDDLWVGTPLNSPKRGRPRAPSLCVNNEFGRVVLPSGKFLSDITNLTCYRFRASVARIVALSIQGGAHAVCTVFNHTDIEQTMSYYRARGDFEEELQNNLIDVARTLGNTMTGNAVAGLLPVKTLSMVSEVMDAVDDTSKQYRNANVDLGVDTAQEAAELLGKGATIIRPGVVCVARGLFKGRCSTQIGVRDPGNCSPDCTYNFELREGLTYRANRARWHMSNIADLEYSQANQMRLRFHVDGLIESLRGFEGPLALFKNNDMLKKIFRSMPSSYFAHCSDEELLTVRVFL